MLRGRTPPPSSAQARRASWQLQAQAGRGRREDADRLIGGQDDADEYGDWRQNAQMLTERDEMLLLAGGDALDVAPVNRRRLQANLRQGQQLAARRAHTPTTTETSSRQSPDSAGHQKRTSIFTLHKSAPAESAKKKLVGAKKGRPRSSLLRDREEDDDDDDDDEGERPDQDDSSSISFARSGCHSILSAWRIKAANRAARLAASKRAKEQPRPRSVLSNSSSIGKKSAASTAFTQNSRATALSSANRIPLGPKSAQHFVTNTRRRRRANELIMNTLEARRQAITLNRQNILGSLFGSESFLGGAPSPAAALAERTGERALLLQDDYQRLSMSPSPARQLIRSPSPYGDSTAAVELTKRSALSDLGGRQSPATAAQRSKLVMLSRANRQNSSPLLAGAGAKQRSRLSQLSGSSGGRPPLAKLDQNSSDLCSSNDSSSGGDDHSSSSSCSQFTQLVTSELAPSQILLGDQESGLYQDGNQRARREPPTQAKRASPVARPPPKPLSRTKRRQLPPPARSPVDGKHTRGKEGPPKQQVSTTSEEDDKTNPKLRRGALNRDSIRRLRMTRQHSEQQEEAAGSSSSNDLTAHQGRLERRQQRASFEPSEDAESPSQTQVLNLRPLSKARKLDIENNPFLNRHHFRTLSARSSDSRQSAPSQSQRSAVASPTRPVRPPEEQSARDNDRRRLPAPARQGPDRSASRSPSSRPAAEVPQDYQIQMPQIDMENVRQVERMLRDMRPAQVATPRRGERPPEAKPERQQAARDESGGENVFKTTTRLVREGARFSDNLKGDMSGSRKQVELLERWRHELQPPVRRDDGSIFSEERHMSERLETRKSQELIRCISPPAEFSDKNLQVRRAPSPTKLRPFVPVQPPKPSDRFSAPASSSNFRLEDRTSAPRPFASRPLASDNARSRQAPARLEAEPERAQWPPVVPRSRSSKSESATSRGRDESPKRVSESFVRASLNQTSLPKFERTADDEFRKRVDQLRQMARAHLEDSEASKAQEARRKDQMRLVKPISTNWDGPKAEQERQPLVGRAATTRQSFKANSELAFAPSDRGAKFKSSLALQAQSRPRSSSTDKRVASTNLDDMLLADRYQRPLDSAAGRVGVWRRSNSSLASMGSSRPSPASAALNRSSRPLSPPLGGRQAAAGSCTGSVLSQSAMSVGPRESELSAPMRVIVREKRAPQLDFAHVEQREPSTQLARTVEQPTKTRQASYKPEAQPPNPRRAPAETTTAPISLARPSSLTAKAMPGSSTLADPAVSSPKANQPSRQSSSLSPDCGRAATSSNDDSAIASSVSSPSSVNFAMSSPAQPAAQSTSSNAQTPKLSNLSPQSTSFDASTTASPALTIQSILRRQQFASQQQGAPQSQEASGQQPGHQQTFPMQTQLRRQEQSQMEKAAPAQEQRQASSAQILQQEQQLSNQKRVHFNDRTSVRSFESISSTNSNTTAIQQHQQSDLDDYSARQQVGSPDSMGSGSTSRLSCESPAFGDFRRPGGVNEGLGGAAIYAIRGDPELDVMVSPPQPFLPAANYQQQSPQLYVDQQQRAMVQRQSPGSVHYGAPQGQSYSQTPGAGQAPQRHQQMVPLDLGPIRMTAPPAINTSQPAYRAPNLMAPATDRLASRHQTLIAGPDHRALRSPGQQIPDRTNLVSGALDEEDPDYALRLRQAATRRVFNYGQQQAPQQQPQQSRAAFAPFPMPPRGSSGDNVATQAQRRQQADLANFQTEV